MINDRERSHPPSPMTRLNVTQSHYRPFASPSHNVQKGRYITSNDPRGYIPVYEYPLNGQWIMMDIDDGYILWTGIWKALGNSKADIVKMLDSHPDLAAVIRRVRGGYLKIQGTWMPYESAVSLARRVAWPIRNELIPLFGPTFPSTCLSPDQPGYGQVITPKSRRRTRRQAQPTHSAVVRESPYSRSTYPSTSMYEEPNWRGRRASWTEENSSPFAPPMPSRSPHLHTQRTHRPVLPPLDTHVKRDSSHLSPRYSPYPPHRNSMPRLSITSTSSASSAGDQENLRLAPLRISPVTPITPPSPYALPSVAALEDLRGVNSTDSAAVLRRLKEGGDDYYRFPAKRERPPAPSVHEVLGRCQRDFLHSE